MLGLTVGVRYKGELLWLGGGVRLSDRVKIRCNLLPYLRTHRKFEQLEIENSAFLSIIL